MPRLIVIDGIDGCGKKTQVELLQSYLKDSILIDYPNYDSRSSELVKMYLNGEIDKDPYNINPYLASTFYACDRAINLKNWIDDYNNDKYIIANRYSSSNIIHQTSKLPKNEWDTFINWCNDLEYNRFKIPKPDIVLFLDLPLSISEELMKKRYTTNGIYDESKKDIHENNLNYLKDCKEVAKYVINKLHWITIHCADENGNLKSIEEIHNEIKKVISFFFNL